MRSETPCCEMFVMRRPKRPRYERIHDWQHIQTNELAMLSCRRLPKRWYTDQVLCNSS
jgi:hypothetical protein